MRRTLATFFAGVAALAIHVVYAQTISIPQSPGTPVTPNVGKDLVLNSNEQPNVTNWSPHDFAVVGDKLIFQGTLGATNFHASVGNPAVELPIQSFSPAATPASSITVSIPANAPIGAGPLVVWYGSNGTRKTLSTTFKVLKRPQVTALRVITTPRIAFIAGQNRDVTIELDVADFDPSVVRGDFLPSLWSSNCIPNGFSAVGQGVQTMTPGTPYKMRFGYTFLGIELSGHHCSMQLKPYFDAGSVMVQAGEVVLPTYTANTITSTWDLTQLTTASGKKMSASSHNGPAPCELASVGKQGTFSTGVVNDGGALSFQLRNGLLQENCEFLTSTGLQVKDDWFVKTVDWQFTRDSNCTATEFGTQLPSGQTVSFFGDSQSIFAVRFQATCVPEPADLTNNRHLYKARLASVVLIGPAGQDWHNAFK